TISFPRLYNSKKEVNPISRSLYPPADRKVNSLGFLSFIWTVHCWTSLTTYPSRTPVGREDSEQLPGIPQPIWSFNPRGLPQCLSPGKAVGSYPTFSPLPRLRRGGIFSVALFRTDS